MDKQEFDKLFEDSVNEEFNLPLFHEKDMACISNGTGQCSHLCQWYDQATHDCLAHF